MGSRKKLSIVSFSMAAASIGVIHLFLLSVAASFGIGSDLVKMMSSVLIGFDSTPAGVFTGMVWGFLIGGTYGFIFAWLYNKML